jgi:hypothetical protein
MLVRGIAGFLGAVLGICAITPSLSAFQLSRAGSLTKEER